MQWTELHFEPPSECSFSGRRPGYNRFVYASSLCAKFMGTRFLKPPLLSWTLIGSPQIRPKRAKPNAVTISHLRTMGARPMACQGGPVPRLFCLSFLVLSVRYCSRRWSKLTTTSGRNDLRVQQESKSGIVRPPLPAPAPLAVRADSGLDSGGLWPARETSAKADCSREWWAIFDRRTRSSFF